MSNYFLPSGYIGKLLLVVFITMGFNTLARAQQVTITGQVSNKSGEPLAGTSINVKGTPTTVLANENGTFSISCTSNSTPAISDMTIKWDESDSNERKLERIITQYWIAQFPDATEAWTTFRRTGYPKLFPVVVNESGGLIATDIQTRRLPYPQSEYQTNNAEVAKAVLLLGGPDTGGTRLWWDLDQGNF